MESNTSSNNKTNDLFLLAHIAGSMGFFSVDSAASRNEEPQLDRTEAKPSESETIPDSDILDVTMRRTTAALSHVVDHPLPVVHAETSEILCDRPISDCMCVFCSGAASALQEGLTWKQLVKCVLMSLQVRDQRQYFSLSEEILPFLDSHWPFFCATRGRKNWESKVSMILSKYTDDFSSGYEALGCKGFWGLSRFDVFKHQNELLERHRWLKRGREDMEEDSEANVFLKHKDVSEEEEGIETSPMEELQKLLYRTYQLEEEARKVAEIDKILDQLNDLIMRNDIREKDRTRVKRLCMSLWRCIGIEQAPTSR